MENKEKMMILKRKKKINLKKYFFSGIAILVLLIILSYAKPSIISPLKKGTQFIIRPFHLLTSNMTEKSNNILDRIFGGPQLKKENNELRNENAYLQEENKKLLDTIGKEEYLRKEYELLNLKNDLIPGNIIGKDSGGLFVRFTIDKGTKDGVDIGDIIVTGADTEEGEVAIALIGRIIDIGYNWATVQSILDDSVGLSFKNIRSQDYGILDGRTNKGLSGYLFDPEGDVLKGDIITTSGLTPVYPEGLIIGFVQSFEVSEFDRLKHIFVEAEADLSRLFRVMIMKNQGEIYE